MSSIFNITTSKYRQLDRATQAAIQITEDQVKDPPTLARLFQKSLRDIAGLLHRFAPDYTDFEDQPFDGTGTTRILFPHKLNARVRWWIVDWTDITGNGPVLSKHNTTDLNTLVLVSKNAGTGTLRVMKAG